MYSPDLCVHVIDDDSAVRDSLEALLLVCGYDVATYPSAEAFLNGPAEKGGCILVDVHMPGMSGLDLLERLVRAGDRLPVLILTASREARLRERALELGACAFLNKPVTEQALLEALTRAQAAEPAHKGNP